ncbi:hypothetical protein OZY43_01250 [Lactobacillus sp. ESL0785]|uniref:hypothetical protein n=1 Tax=Lactobacillus sp. ESL0785 TaxID=2983232 RepID=UPI0023F7A7C8|nr:hypothetical protein [Lactobacillus sp. ESL0785]WEV71094.1 hypothetical protein OZY43_01250 [Lactobacillus sp. ESL0785]
MKKKIISIAVIPILAAWCVSSISTVHAAANDSTTNSSNTEGITVISLTGNNTSIILAKNNPVFVGGYAGTITWTLNGAAALATQSAK